MLTKKEKLIFIIIGTLMNYSVLSDPDFGWHLKYGEWFFKHGQVLRDNIFSYTMADYKWVNSYWASELFLYVVFTFLGPIILSLILSFILSLVQVLAANKTNSSSFIKGVFLVLCWASFNVFHISIRPFLFSTVFLLGLTYTLLYKRSYIKFLPLLFLLWTNMHADFMLGLYIFGVFSVSEVIKAVKNNGAKIERGLTAVAKPTLILFLCVLATVINPFGFGLWRTMLREVFTSQSTIYISEWVAFLRVPKLNILYVLNMVPNLMLLVLASIPFFKYRKKYGLWYLFINITFLLLTIRSIYFLRIFLVIGMFGIIEFWEEIYQAIRSESRLLDHKIIEKIPRIVAGFVLIFVPIGFLIKLNLSLNPEKLQGLSFCSENTLSFIRESKPAENMYNDFSLGGFLIWKLPEYKTLIDGRMNSWEIGEKSLFINQMKVLNKPGENSDLFAKTVDKYKIGWVITRKERPLEKYLLTQGGIWEMKYNDESCSVFVKKNLPL